MKQYFALLRKEYLETRAQTSVFLIMGLALPLFQYLQAGFVHPADYLYGATFALILNVATLCAIAFARERENGTLETLRRVVSDWRVAAFAKFSYAFISTLVLSVVFLGVSLVVDSCCHYVCMTTFFKALSRNGDLFFSFLKGAGLLCAFCWGIFWTGRVERQATAIFLTFASAAFCGIVSADICRALFDKWELYADVLTLAVSILAAACGPLRGRFGYVNVGASRSQRDVSIKNEPSPTVDRSSVKPSDDSRPSPLLAIYRHVLAESALLFRSPASLLFETAILIVAASLLTTFYLDPVANALKGWTLFGVYALAVSSGLFLDSKRNGDPLKERFNVQFGVYWLANALAMATFTLVFALGLAFFSGAKADSVPFLVAAPVVALFAGSALWSASLRGGRLVVAARTLLPAALALGFVHLLFKDPALELAETSGISRAQILLYAIACFLVLSSIYASARELKGKKPGLLPLTPVALLVIACVAPILYGFVASLQPQKLPERAPVNPAYAEIFGGTWTPGTPVDPENFYAKREETSETLKPTLSPDLFPNSPAWARICEVAQKMETSNENTRKLVGASGESYALEGQFHAEVRSQILRALAPENSWAPTLNLLESLRQKRPSYVDAAVNSYLTLARFGADTKATRRRLDVIELARWNVCQAAPEQSKFIDFALNGYCEDRSQLPFPTPVPRAEFPDDTKLFPYATSFRWGSYRNTAQGLYNSEISNSGVPVVVSLEIQRRLEFLTLAVRKVSDRKYQLPQTYRQLIQSGEVPDSLCVPRNPRTLESETAGLPVAALNDPEWNRTSITGLYPLITTFVETPSPENAEPETLEPFIDFDQRQLTTPDRRKASTRRQGGRRIVKTQFLPPSPSDLPDVDNDGAPDPVEYSRWLPLLYDDAGAPMFDVSGAGFYGCEYHAVDWRGEPVLFFLTPCDVPPPFELDGCELFNGQDRYGAGKLNALDETSFNAIFADKSLVCRVRAFKLFERNGENSFLVKDLWYVHEAVKPNDPPRPGQEASSPAPTGGNGKFVDSSGHEVLDRSGKPMYALKRGAFADKRHVSKPNYQYVFDLPDGIAENAEGKLQILYVGEGSWLNRYETFDSDAVVLENGRVYSKFQAVGLAARSSWFVNPRLPRDHEEEASMFQDSPVLIIEPVRPHDASSFMRQPVGTWQP